MYVPAHFRVEDRAELLGVIEAFPLGLLITQDEQSVYADPIPMLLAEAGTKLLAHVARPNPLWQRLSKSPQVLIVFQGQDHYISPGYYPSKVQTGKAVPTWNYVNVQARGFAKVHEDAHWLHTQVQHLTDRHERDQEQPWSVDDAPQDYMASQLNAIVGLEISIASLEGKFKVSQNKSLEDREGVVSGLEAKGSEAAAMAQLVRTKAKMV